METDEQQIEEFKKWWKENGRTVVFGLVLGLGGVIGWTTWREYTHSQAELASARYEQLVNTAAQNNHEQALRQADALIEEFPDSGYAPLAALLVAGSAYAQEQTEKARQHLEWVAENAETAALRDVARVRLARLLAAGAQPDAALGHIEALESGGFAAAAAELRADIELARGDTGAARTGYEAAIAENLSPDARARVQMKLDDLGRANIP